MSSAPTPSEFQLHIDPRKMMGLMAVSSVTSIGFLVLIFRKLANFQPTVTVVGGIALLLFLSAAGTWLSHYFWSLFINKKAGLKFSPTSWEDAASLLHLGKRPFSSLRRVGVEKSLSLEFLILDFNKELLKSGDLVGFIYKLIVGPTLIIPLWFFEESSNEIVSVSSQVQTAIKLRGQPASLRHDTLENPEKNAIIVELAARQKPSGPPKAQDPTGTMAKAEKAGQSLCHLYSEELILYSDGSPADHIPTSQQLVSVTFKKGERGEERYSFHLHETPFVMELFRKIEGSEHGSLLFYSGQELLMKLQVSVEIGSVDLVAVDAYIPGPWESSLLPSAAYK